MSWEDIKGQQLVTRLIQRKTVRPVVLTLHATARKMLERQHAKASVFGVPTGLIFDLPTQDGANKVLGVWALNAGLDKHITWSCARLSFSVLLQDERVDNATVSLLLGHTITRQVERTYKRHRPKPQMEAINVLPSDSETPRNKLRENERPTTYIYKYTVVPN